MSDDAGPGSPPEVGGSSAPGSTVEVAEQVSRVTIGEAYAGTEAIDVGSVADSIAVSSSIGVEGVVGRWSSPAGRLLRTTLALSVFLVVVGILWEVFKWLFGDPWRLTGILGTEIDYFHRPPFYLNQASDVQLPHLWTIGNALLEPFARNQDMSLLGYLIDAALYTWREAVIGFVLGALIGIVLAAIFVHYTVAERALLPYVIASQAIPIVALSPILVVAFGRGLTSVVIIATYLTFFPVTIAMTRGLRSPDPRAVELMRSYAASRWSVLWKVRLPASVPYLFTALKIAAVASIVGAIIGEGPGGIQAGLGRAIIVYYQQYIIVPEKMWATIFVTALAGILFFLLLRVIEVIVLRSRPPVEA